MNEHRNANNQLTFDFDKISSGSYKTITEAVVKKFNLEPSNNVTIGLDEKFQEFKVGNLKIGLEWDNWSGYIVDAKGKEAESLVREIAKYINEHC